MTRVLDFWSPVFAIVNDDYTVLAMLIGYSILLYPAKSTFFGSKNYVLMDHMKNKTSWNTAYSLD